MTLNAESSQGKPSSDWMFRVAVFASAALLFQVQPLISKLVLPRFGGTPQVWTVCLLFFQTLLCVGYAFAYLLARRCPPRDQTWMYAGLLALAGVLAPIVPTFSDDSGTSATPALEILQLLLKSVGLPYLLLSATGPLLQDWYYRVFRDARTYRLYALSNAGSLLGLLTYPFLIEPVLPISQQVWGWRIGYWIYVAAAAYCAWLVYHAGGLNVVAAQPVQRERVTWESRAWWFSLAMVPTILLPSITEKLSVDVSSGPFLWVLPLALYLLTMIVCFSRENPARTRFWLPATVMFLVATVSVMIYEAQRSVVPLWLQFTVFLGVLTSGCMLCHAELLRRKPAPGNLVEFYLIVSAGGACGGIFVGLLAPQWFATNLELHLGLLLCYLVPRVALLRDAVQRGQTQALRANVFMTLGITAGLVAALCIEYRSFVANAHLVSRNFYGVIRIQEYNAEVPEQHLFEMVHGMTVHGFQFVHEPMCRVPTTYYGPTSGVGLAIASRGTSEPRRIGVVGLGAGTLAAYGQAGDEIDFYEINPDVIAYARDFFRYLQDTPAKVEIVAGDGRLSLERLEPQNYDVLVLDAFGSDAIPMHLLTEEALQIYLKHLKPDGILAIHISNRHVDLIPVLAGHVDRMGLALAVLQDNQPSTQHIMETSQWGLLARTADPLQRDPIRQHPTVSVRRSVTWTDEHCSLLPVMRWPW